jgi:hypothetical protein
MERPVGVTVIAVLDFVGAFFMVMIGLFLIFGMGLIGAASNRPGGMVMFAGLGAFGAVVMFIFAAIAVAVGYGLINLQNWARIVTIVLAGIGLVFAVPSLLFLVVRFHPFAIMSLLVRVAINALILWYMLQRQVKQAFAAPW